MENEILIKNLQKRLSEYRNSNLYINKALKQDINSIQIALALFEMKLFCDRPIKDYEKHWFNGGYYISNDITGEWEDIALMYDELVRSTKKK